MVHARAIAALILAAAGLAALAANVIGGETPGPPGNPPGPNASALEVERVAGPAGKRAPKPRVFYLETRQALNDIPPGPGGEIIEKCPKKSVAINGYFYKKELFTGFGLDEQGSSPAGFRKWAFYWDNVATDTEGKGVEIDGVILGMVCDKDG